MTVKEKIPDSPYKGLVPFSDEDAPFFFGREKEIQILTANLRTRRLTLLYGPTGAGKSSVLNAGVVYHVQHLNSELQLAGSHFADDILVTHGSPAALSLENVNFSESDSPITVVVFGKWIGDALISLKDAILAALNKSLPDIFTFRENERLRGLSLRDMLERITATHQVLELLIILDQFEEYFVYHPTFEGEGRFADEFSKAIVSPGVHANFLISIREDWLAQLDRFKGRIPNLFDNSIRIDHLERTAAQDAIEKPLMKFNELIRDQGSGRAQVSIEEGFVPAALNQLQVLDDPGDSEREGRAAVVLQRGKRHIQASRLQLVMEHLWERVEKNSHPVFGAKLLKKADTVKRIFKLHLEESLKDLTSRERTIAADLFRFLITPSNTKFATTVRALSRRSRWPPEEINSLLEKLAERKVSVLTRVAPSPGQDTSDPHFEITSDVLAGTILTWSEEQQALDEAQVAESRLESTRKSRRLWATLIVFIALAVGFAVWGLLPRRLTVEDRRRIADEEWRRSRLLLGPIMKLDEQIPYSRAVLRGHTGKVTSAVFVSVDRVLTASADGTAILWNVDTKDRVIDFNRYEREEKPLIRAAMSPDGDAVVTANTDGSVLLWSSATGENTELRGRVGKHITDLSFSPAGDLIVGANTWGDVIVWNTGSGERVKEIAGDGKAITQLAFSPSGNLLAVASQDSTARVWRRAEWDQVDQRPPSPAATPRGPSILAEHKKGVNSLAFSPDESFLATASEDNTARLWDLSNTDKSIHVFEGHTASINSVSFDASGTHLLTASDDGTARIWEIATANWTELKGHADKVLSASFSPNGQQVVTAGKDKVARIWAFNGTPLVELHGHDDEVTYVTYSKDGKYVLTASDDRTARVWYVPEYGEFEIAQPIISAVPKFHPGDCPVTITFSVAITALKGSGTVVYRFKGSDERVWPFRELPFDKPGTTYLTWYWRITDDTTGYEAIEVIEPRGIKEQRARFKVICRKPEIVAPPSEPTATPSPSPTSPG